MAGLMEVVRGRISQDVKAPQLQDWVAFPDAKTADTLYKKLIAANSKAQAVVHNLADAHHLLADTDGRVRTLLEINPGMTDDEGQLLTLDALRRELDEARTDPTNSLSGVVYDTKHVRRGMRLDEVTTVSFPQQSTRDLRGGWRNVLSAIGHDIQLIDFQALAPAELHATLNHQRTELADMARELAATYPHVPVRLEIQLGMKRQLMPGNVLSVMNETADFLREMYG